MAQRDSRLAHPSCRCSQGETRFETGKKRLQIDDDRSLRRRLCVLDTQLETDAVISVHLGG